MAPSSPGCIPSYPTTAPNFLDMLTHDGTQVPTTNASLDPTCSPLP